MRCSKPIPLISVLAALILIAVATAAAADVAISTAAIKYVRQHSANEGQLTSSIIFCYSTYTLAHQYSRASCKKCKDPIHAIILNNNIMGNRGCCERNLVASRHSRGFVMITVK